MALITIGRFRPSGSGGADFRLPGPGLYELDFAVPNWAFPDFDTRRTHSFRVGRYYVEHLHTVHSDAAGKLTSLVRVTYSGEAISQTPGVEAFGIDDLAMATIVRGLAVILGTWVAAHLIDAIANAIREVRRVIEIGPVQVALGAVAVIFLVPRAFRVVKGAVT